MKENNEASTEKDNEENTEENAEKINGKVSEEDKSENKDENNDEVGNSNNETTDGNTDDVILKEPDLMLKNATSNNLLNTNNSLSLQSANGEVEDQITPEELNKQIKATTKEDIEDKKQSNKYKTKNDSYEIRTFETQVVSGASKDKNGNFVWNATSSAKGHEFTFRVNYAISGYGELPAGAVKITIPKQILRNRNGNLDDNYIMSLPNLSECKEEGTMAELIYKEDGDYLVIYNSDKVDSGLNGYFEVSYATNSQSYNYKDYDAENSGLVKNGGTASDGFYAIMELNVEKDSDSSEKNILNNITDDKSVFINTNVKLQSTQKRYPSIYQNWNSSWMQNEPTNSNEYYYLVWEISSYIDDVTQKYNFTLEDFVTDLTEGTQEGDYELVGYKLSGEKYYSTKNTQENQTTSGYRYDYVLTKHKKSVYAGKSYKLKNTVTATVHPIDGVDDDTNATSSNTFSWDPSFVPPTGYFNVFKYGNNTGFGGRYANYDLDKLQTGEVDYLRNFKYKTETIGYAYPWTLRDGGSKEDPGDYGESNVTYTTYDDTLYLEGDENPMSANDYYLEYLTYSIRNSDAEYDYFYNKFNQVNVNYADDEIITFYATFGDGDVQNEDKWVPIGTYKLKTKELTPNTEYVKEMTLDKITFKEGVHATGWKFTTSNKHYYTGITVTPTYVLTNSAYVMEKIADKSSIKIQNNVTTNITDYNGDEILTREDKAFDYARVTYYDSDISKSVASVSNKKKKKQYTITWKINAWEKATSGEGTSEYIEQESGKFYDIIPLGGDVDVNSIQVQTEKGFLEDYEYSYEVIANYKNSGRTMLVITINEQADFYNVYYTTVHSWESMKDYGKNVLNPVAFETGNEKITNGYPDDGGNLSEENKNLFNDIDSETDDKKFLYAERTYNINALTTAISGLQNKVKSSKDEDYKYDTEVEPGESYTYRLRFENTYMNSAKNLVFFDSIENFKVVDEEEGTEKTSGWHGTLKGIDLSQLTKKGIDAKVYISTIENLDLESYNDLSNTSIWQLVDASTNLSTAKALAIDMTKNTNGEEYVLSSGDSVLAVLYMQAPENPSQEIEQNQYAYANVYMQNTLIDDLGGTVDYFIHQDYTTVKYHVVADVPIHKVNAQNEEEGIKGITFRLYGTSNYGNDVDEYITTAQNGYATFKGIEAGNYILQEYEGNKDWIEDHTEHTVEINMDKKVYVDGNEITKENMLKITNVPRAHTDVTIYKKDLVNKAKPVEGAKFKLSGTSDYGNEILMYAISDSQGKVTFEDIEKGTYELIEVSTADGYTLNKFNKETFRVIVDENSNYDVEKQYKGTNSKTETRYSHTSNINDSGYASSDYGNNLSITDTVKIEGAERLDIEVYYSTESSQYDWINVYDNNGNSLASNLGGNKGSRDYVNSNGYENACYKWTGTVLGDTAQIYFKSDGSVTNYGYYAIIKGTIKDEFEYYETIYNNGTYEIYNEPLHGFNFMKKDLIDKNKAVSGVTFKVNGTSDYGNYFEKTATSDEKGKVTFSGLEKGTYTLKEISTTEEYVLNTDTYTVTIDKMGDFVIQGNHLDSTDGKYSIYNEPKHSFYFTKKDLYNKEKLGGAKFRLYGSSNIGNLYDETATSVEGTGIVTFENLESGTYFLKEIETPNTDDAKYVPDEEERTIEVSEDGKITLNGELIWPLDERDENEPYVWFNTRNKGQITITKKWVDDLTNDQRQEPKIFISTIRGEQTYSKVYFRTIENDKSIIDYVTSENVTAFKRNLTLTEDDVRAKPGVKRLDNNFADDNAEYKIYAWVDDGTLYWWTKADRAVLPANLNNYFKNEEGLKDISWNTIYKKGYWTGNVGSEEISQSITSMKNMFYGCTNLENLDISWFNNSGITEENMQYVFGNNGDSPAGAMKKLKYITIGENFNMFDTSVLPKGKWKNQKTNEKKPNTELVGNVPDGTYEKSLGLAIGTKVNYSTTLNNVELNDWKVFYVDKEKGYTYIILEDYLPNSAVNISGIQKNRTYNIYSNTNRAHLISALDTKSNWSSLLSGTLNGTVIDYTNTTDENIYAMGSPTLDLWVKSWNTSYPEDTLYTHTRTGMSDSIGWGYYIGANANLTGSDINLSSKTGYSNTLYYPHTRDYNYCYGYWLASPAGYYANYVMYVHYDGGVRGNYYFIDSYAARPLVCLPSDILE